MAEINDDDIIKKKPDAKCWDRVKALYIAGESIDSIIKALPRYNLSQKSIYRKMALDGVTAKKKALDARITDHVLNVVEEEKIKVNNDCIRLFNTGAEVISKLLNCYNEELENGEISKGKARATAYNIDMLMSGVTKVQKGLRVAYGMDENGKLYEKEPEVLVIEGVDTGKI